MLSVDSLVSDFIAIGVYGIDGVVQEACNLVGIIDTHPEKCKYAQFGGESAGSFDDYLLVGLQQLVEIFDESGVYVQERFIEVFVELLVLLFGKLWRFCHLHEVFDLPGSDFPGYGFAEVVEAVHVNGAQVEEMADVFVLYAVGIVKLPPCSV